MKKKVFSIALFLFIPLWILVYKNYVSKSKVTAKTTQEGVFKQFSKGQVQAWIRKLSNFISIV